METLRLSKTWQGSGAWLLAVAAALLLSGCSPKDAPTYTPQYHVGTPTNRSSVNSWELDTEPVYTQPGAYGGKPVKIKPVPASLRLEPNDPLAESVYSAISADRSLNTRYLSTLGKNGVVEIIGTMPTTAQRDTAVAIARKVAGVRHVDCQITIQS